MVFVMHAASRAYGFIVFRTDLSISVWSTSCVCLQFCVFLTCRYIQELHDRKKFLLQLEILQLRSNLQDVLDGMMPHSIADRVRAGEVVMDAHEQAAVLICSFPADAPPQTDAMPSFLLLDRVHLLLDDLLATSRFREFKVEFVGNDYLLTSAAPSACAALGGLAARMSAAARRELAGSGLELRFGLAAGPVFAAVVGETRKHLRFLGAAAEEARGLAEVAGPWQASSR